MESEDYNDDQNNHNQNISYKLSEVNPEDGNGNKFIDRIKKIYDGWLNIRAKLEEIMEPVLFFGGGTLTALIALGILPWGALGIGICATLTFIGISRFVLTNSWTLWHNRWDEGKKENENEVENTENGNEEEEKEESEEDVNREKEKKQGTGFVKGPCEVFSSIKSFIIPSALAITGVIFGIFGAVGTLGLGLALGIGIPSFILGATSLVIYLTQPESFKLNISDNLWGVSMLVAGLLSVATFAVLGLTGVLALPTAIALGAPALALTGIMTLIFVATCIGYWVKNRGKEADDEKEPCSLIGLSWNPEWLVSKKEKLLGGRLDDEDNISRGDNNYDYDNNNL